MTSNPSSSHISTRLPILCSIRTLKPNEWTTPQEFHCSLINWLETNDELIVEETRRAKEEDLKIVYTFYKCFIVRYYYEYALNLSLSRFEKVEKWGRSIIETTDSDKPPVDHDYVAKEREYIKTDKWANLGCRLWPHILRMIYKLHSYDIMDHDPEHFNLTKEICTFTNAWTSKVYADGSKKDELEYNLEIIMAKCYQYMLGLDSDPNATTPIEVWRNSLDFFVSSSGMIDPSYLVPSYDPTTVIDVDTRLVERIHATVEFELHKTKPSAKLTNMVRQLIFILTGYPNIRNMYITKQKCSDIQKYSSKQYNLFLYESLRQEDAMRDFQYNDYAIISKWNPQEYPLSWLWQRMSNVSNMLDTFKIIMLHLLIKSKTSYSGFLPLYVKTFEQFEQQRDVIMERSQKFPVIVKLDPCHYWILHNKTFAKASPEAIMMYISNNLKNRGLPPFENWEDDPSIYLWAPIARGLCTDANVLISNTVKGNLFEHSVEQIAVLKKKYDELMELERKKNEDESDELETEIYIEEVEIPFEIDDTNVPQYKRKTYTRRDIECPPSKNTKKDGDTSHESTQITPLIVPVHQNPRSGLDPSITRIEDLTSIDDFIK